MRCRKCGLKAAINMRHHKLSLCEEHYLDWLPEQVQRTIEKFKMFTDSDSFLIAVSGGKDSLALWDILNRLGYETEGLYINLGIDEGISYSDQSEFLSRQFAEERDITLNIVDLKEDFGGTIPEIVSTNPRAANKPCSVCGIAKRHIMNSFALKNDFKAVVTGHNLDDETALLLSNTLNWSLDYLARGLPLLSPGPGLCPKAKPFCRVYERESAAYAFLRGIQFIQDECPFSLDNRQLYFKKYLGQWEQDMPGTKLRFYGNYLKSISNGAFSEQRQSVKEMSEHRCTNCGQPTMSGGLCNFCRLFEKQFSG
jgi:uncharacterized protein (TIGR00269 family)